MHSIRPSQLVPILALAWLAVLPPSVRAERQAPLDPGGESGLFLAFEEGAVRALPSRKVIFVAVAGNHGPGPATGARLRAVPPVALESPTWRCTGSGGARCVSETGPGGSIAAGTGAVDQFVDLPAGSSLVLTIRGTLAPEATGEIVQHASIAPPAGFPDPDLGDNQASDADPILRPFEVTKEVSGTFRPGEPVVYVITAINQTEFPQLDNPGPELEDDLPPEIVATGVTASTGSASLDPAANRVEWDGVIPAFGTLTLVIEGTIRPSAAGRAVSNQGRLLFALVLDASTDTLAAGATNDGLAFSEDPVTGGPTVFQAIGPLAVPTLDALALLLLAALLGTAAVALLGRA